MAHPDIDLPEEISLFLPSGEMVTSTMQYTRSYFNANGCTGYLRPAEIFLDSERLLVQVKRFYESSVDDRGDQFFQDPEEEVKKSYVAFKDLKKKGFKIVPFYAIGKGKDEKSFLLVTDLSQGETLEVFDEKALHREREELQIINGRQYKVKGSEVVDGLANNNEIHLTFMQTKLLQQAHNIDLGYGVAHMVVRNPETNLGEAYISDVGEYYQKGDWWGIKTLIPFTELLKVPYEDIENIYEKLLKRFYPRTKPEDVLENLNRLFPSKRLFQDLMYQSAIGLSLQAGIPSAGDTVKWARKRFTRSDLCPHDMSLKLHFQEEVEYLKELLGSPPFLTDRESYNRLTSSRRNTNAFPAWDFAFLGVLDRTMRYLSAVRESVKSKKPLPEEYPPLFLDQSSFPQMNFFDNYDEIKDPEKIREMVILRRDEDWKGMSTTLTVDFNWARAREIELTAGGSLPVFHPEQIVKLEVDGKPVAGFDSQRVKRFLWKMGNGHGYITYLYNFGQGLKEIYCLYLTSARRVQEIEGKIPSYEI